MAPDMAPELLATSEPGPIDALIAAPDRAPAPVSWPSVTLADKAAGERAGTCRRLYHARADRNALQRPDAGSSPRRE